MKTKKLVSMLLVVCMIASMLVMSGCGKSEAPTEAPTKAPTEAAVEAPAETEAPAVKEESNELVIYTAVAQSSVDTYVAEFEAETGIEVELISAGTGELLKRIESEADNPLGDIEWGGTTSVVLPYAEFFEPYVSVNEDVQMEACKNLEGCITSYDIMPFCLIVNTDLIGDIEINGYEDLLNPELKGKIAYVDPSQSSTGLTHLLNMLLAMGGDDIEKGWEFVEKFVENLDGKLLTSSGAIARGVADGEYVVGLTVESGVSEQISYGAPVKPVYMEEGVLCSAGTVQIIKGCKNLENAKKFVDFVTSKAIQESAAAAAISERGSRTDVATPEGLTDVKEMKILVQDLYETQANTQNYLDRFKDIYTK